jgi:hypothetical protein
VLIYLNLQKLGSSSIMVNYYKFRVRLPNEKYVLLKITP